MTNFVRRPWVEYYENILKTNDKLDQQCKLIRNQMASMDLGNPHFKLYDSHHEGRTGRLREELPTSRERYLEWVADWKYHYSSCQHSSEP